MPIACIWAWFSTGILMAVPTCLSLEPNAPDSPKVTPFCTAFHLPEPMGSGCEHNFACWPFSRCLCLQKSLPLLGREKALLFTTRCYVDFISLLWCPEVGNLVWGLGPVPLSGNLLQMRYLSGSSAAAGGSTANPVHFTHPCQSQHVFFSSLLVIKLFSQSLLGLSGWFSPNLV